MIQDENIKLPPKPSKSEVRKSLNKWKRLHNYVRQEEALEELFITKTYKENKKIENVLIKVCTLNEFYSTYMYKPLIVAIASHIVDLDIDKRIESGCHTIVNKIGEKITAKSKDIVTEQETGKDRRSYSFATKYCYFSFLTYSQKRERPNPYPIYDSYVKKTLFHFHKNDKNEGFLNFLNENNNNKELSYYKFERETQCYHKFYEAINVFKNYYGIEKFKTKEIDKYLWLIGKEYFPNKKKKAAAKATSE